METTGKGKIELFPLDFEHAEKGLHIIGKTEDVLRRSTEGDTVNNTVFVIDGTHGKNILAHVHKQQNNTIILEIDECMIPAIKVKSEQVGIDSMMSAAMSLQAVQYAIAIKCMEDDREVSWEMTSNGLRITNYSTLVQEAPDDHEYQKGYEAGIKAERTRAREIVLKMMESCTRATKDGKGIGSAVIGEGVCKILLAQIDDKSMSQIATLMGDILKNTFKDLGDKFFGGKE